MERRKNCTDITLICLPPAQLDVPSPAFSYLKSYLNMEKIRSNIIYANFVFKKECLLLPSIKDNTDGFSEILPFIGLINEIYHLGKGNYIQTKFQSLYPDIFLYDKSLTHDIIANIFNEYDKVISEIVQEVIDSGVGIVGFTSKFYQWLPSIAVAYKIKQRKPSIKIVIGGWSNSQSAYDFISLHQDIFDYSIWGEGELPLTNLIKFIKSDNNSGIEIINRLVYKKNNSVLKTSSGTLNSYFDYEKTEYVPEFSDYFRYADVKNSNILYPLERGRGCNWNKCAFCYLSQGYRFRLKPNNILLNEINSLISKYGITSFFFTDNDVTGSDLNIFEDLLDGLIRIRKSNPAFQIKMAEIISKNLTTSLIRKMRDAGFKSLQLGIEAISETLLKDINKKQTVLDNFFAIKTCLKYDIDVLGANLIYNTPNETSEMVLNAIENLYYFRFILSNKSFSFNFIPLGVSNFSKYLYIIRKRGQEEIWNVSDYQNLVDDRYHTCIDPFSLFDFISSKRNNELWDDLNKLQDFYKAKEFSYEIIPGEGNKFTYKEYVKKHLIKEIYFEEEIYKKILLTLEKKKYSLCELYEELTKDNLWTTLDIENAINELCSEGLIWIDNINEDIISIIDFSK